MQPPDALLVRGHRRAALHRGWAPVGHVGVALDPQRVAGGGRGRRPGAAADGRPRAHRPAHSGPRTSCIPDDELAARRADARRRRWPTAACRTCPPARRPGRRSSGAWSTSWPRAWCSSPPSSTRTSPTARARCRATTTRRTRWPSAGSTRDVARPAPADCGATRARPTVRAGVGRHRRRPRRRWLRWHCSGRSWRPSATATCGWSWSRAPSRSSCWRSPVVSWAQCSGIVTRPATRRSDDGRTSWPSWTRSTSATARSRASVGCCARTASDNRGMAP